MRAIFTATMLTLWGGRSMAQTFVPRFDRPMASPSGSSQYVEGNKGDLVGSIGRVAEAPKLMPTGATASLPSDRVTSLAAPTIPASAISGGIVAILSLGVLGWVLRGRTHGLGKG